MTAVILDCGTGTVKAGLSGDDAPTAVFPTVVGYPKHSPTTLLEHDRKCDYFVGCEAQLKRGMLSLQSPIEHGIITNWDDMERVWDHVFFNELKVQPEEHPVMLSEPPFTPKQNKEQTARVMFETFDCSALYIGMQSVFALYSTGKTTGVVVDSGEGLTHIVPIFDGFSLPHAVTKLEVAGKELTDYLTLLLNRSSGCGFETSAERDLVREIKEKLCFVSNDPEKQIRENMGRLTIEKQYTLPDGQVITVNNERFKCSEALFNPFLLGLQTPGIHRACYDCIMSCAMDLRKQLYPNIILAGGTTKLPGFDLRLQKEVKNLAPRLMKVKVIANPERRYSVWIGASIFASLITFGTKVWITKQEYEEHGPSIVLK